MDFSKYKAILFDVDKTLTNSNKEITQPTKDCVRKLSERGFVTGVCTGRHFVTIQETLSTLFPKTSLHVMAGGGVVISTEGKIVFQKNIEATIVHQIEELAKIGGLRFLIQTDKGMYGNDRALQADSVYSLHRDPELAMKQLSDLPDWSIPLIVLSDTTDDSLAKLRTFQVNLKDMRSYRGHRYADITARGVTKASGIREWCKITGIKPEEIIGFGDSENDIEFLQTVGYAVAMGNATDEVKAIANEVTDDCDHDGVAHWIENNIV